MLKLMFLSFLAGAASAQTYDFDLQMGGNTYQGDFTYTLSTDTISNVAVSGNGVSFTIDSDPLRGSQFTDTYIWFLSSTNQTLGFQPLAPLGGAESGFTNVFLDTVQGTPENTGADCNPGPTDCSVMSLTEVSDPVSGATRAVEAAEVDVSSSAAALTFLGCCLLIFAGKCRSS